ncbi:unnamed protein product [Angiostrongylus costaricensis]|uniref:CYTOSOL_AP domain-containing protein n=1 Tax=Angiostrongylus costaricensis TaxID=334426 RepID=A0A158PI40_ANGCS|nr:unnamed protein product [Angiostrongylus costaricensis]
MFAIRTGLNSAFGLSQHALVIVGQNKLIKNFPFGGDLEAKFAGEIDARKWNEAMKVLPVSGSLPLVFNQSRIISVPDSASRHNTPSNCHIISRELKTLPFYKGGFSALNIVLICNADNVLANIAAIARSFPLYFRKTGQSPVNVIVEICLADRELTDDDISYLINLACWIREVCRLVDAPPNELTTDAFLLKALCVAEQLGVKQTVISASLGEDLKRQNFGGIYNVGKAGSSPPAFAVLSYEPEDAKETYCLVGKGVVFDTGGMQIKGKTGMPGYRAGSKPAAFSARNLDESHNRDMGGAAAVLGAFYLLVSAKFRHNLHACLCIVENNISPKANKPDDIITMLSGKTVEINNTDAEGRLILADGVYYAKNTLKADVIIDMATLTGTQLYLSGKLHGALLTNCREWEEKACEAGRRSGDLVAPMVFCPDLHFSDLKSPVADMRNSNLVKTEGPPSALAGLFIGSHIEFGEGLKWLHFDIASAAESGDRGTGYGLALLSYLLGHLTRIPMLQH